MRNMQHFIHLSTCHTAWQKLKVHAFLAEQRKVKQEELFNAGSLDCFDQVCNFSWEEKQGLGLNSPLLFWSWDQESGSWAGRGNPEFWHKHINMIILRAYWATHQWPHSHRGHRGMVEMDKCGLYGWGRIEDKLTIAKLWQLKQQAEDFFVTMWWYDCLLLFLEQCCYCIDEMQLCAVLWLKCWE